MKFLYYPLSAIYGFIVFIRNLMFDMKILKQHNFDVPIISVGNLTVGGTGKTPHAEYLISHLQKEFDVAFLSRGYKRHSKGYLLADLNSTLFDIGDEPVQIKQKFPNIPVAVSEKRVLGIQKLLANKELSIDAIILDDAFQHRYVKPDLNILLVDHTKPIYEDQLLPLGRLRESEKSKYRANLIIFTKCPDEMKPIEQRIIRNRLDIRPYQDLFFTTIVYGGITPAKLGASVFNNNLENYTVLLLTGIGNPIPLVEYLDKKVGKIIHEKYPDHHYFSNTDIENIDSKFNEIESGNKMIITTEKDLVRIRAVQNISEEFMENLYYIPIEVKFLNQSREQFNKRIINYVKENRSNSRLYKK